MSIAGLPADTSLEAARVQYEAYRRMEGSQRVRLAFELSESVRQIALAGARLRHPEYTEAQVKLAVIRLTLGERLFRQVYPGVQVAL